MGHALPMTTSKAIFVPLIFGLVVTVNSYPALPPADPAALCPKEATNWVLCKEATYETKTGVSKAIFRRECIGIRRSRDSFGRECVSYLDTSSGRVEVPKAVADGSERVDRAMVRALGTRPAGFGNSNLDNSQFPRFYDLTIEQSANFCLRYTMKFPFAGGASYCVDGTSDDTVHLVAAISLQDAITIARTELNRMGLIQSESRVLDTRLLGFNLRETENGKVEYVVILFEWLPQPPRGPARYPSIQYNFVIDASTEEVSFAKAPYNTPVPR